MILEMWALTTLMEDLPKKIIDNFRTLVLEDGPMTMSLHNSEAKSNAREEIALLAKFKFDDEAEAATAREEIALLKKEFNAAAKEATKARRNCPAEVQITSERCFTLALFCRSSLLVYFLYLNQRQSWIL